VLPPAASGAAATTGQAVTKPNAVPSTRKAGPGAARTTPRPSPQPARGGAV